MRRLLVVAAMLVAPYAGASGDDPPSYTYYKAYSAPDIEPARFQQGQLGVLQPGMQRVYLYTAWRAMMLGPAIRTSAGRSDGLARASGAAFGYGGGSDGSDAATLQAWRAATGRTDSHFDACPSSSTAFALATFRDVRQRKDATPERLRSWVDAQELVAGACKAGQDARYRDFKVLASVVVPAPLGQHEPLHWRQLRGYQRAAALFHVEKYAEAAMLFDQIGATPGHPMQDLGSYLALRAMVRQAAASASTVNRQHAYAALQSRAQSILANPSLGPRHEATRATLRSIRARLLPGEVLADLNKALSDHTADPFEDDRLGDWAAVLRQDAVSPVEGAVRLDAARKEHDFVAWIENLHDCAYRRPEKEHSCAAPAQFAFMQWKRAGTQPWLVATLMLATGLGPGLEHAAISVRANEPGYLTVRYHLARLYRLAGRHDQARGISEAALKLDMPHGTRNLYREERFAVATSIADAAPYMQRVHVDTSQREELTHGFNSDAMGFMFNGLSAANMVVLARQQVLPPDVRARLASSAWMRAELLGMGQVAEQASTVLEVVVPEMKPELATWRSAAGPGQRRHLMLLAALRYQLAPQMEVDVKPHKALPKEQITALAWCRATQQSRWIDQPVAFPWLLPAPLTLGDKVAATSEVTRLTRLKTGSRFIGEHVLSRVRTHPADPELPWLLHLVVKSPLGRCQDNDARGLSRSAFKVLHQQYPGSEWAKKTPFHY